MSRILNLLSLTALFSVFAFPVFAEGSKTSWSSTRLTKMFLSIELSLEVCSSKANAPSSDKGKMILSRAKPLMFKALTARAKKIQPDIEVEDLSKLVRDWYGDQKQKGESRLSEEKICNLFSDEQWRRLLDEFSIDVFAEDMRVFESQTITYKAKIPLVDGSSMKSFALQNFQRIILASIANHADKPDCEDLSVISIELNEERDAEAANLPPFIASPIRYKETWTTMCGKQKQSHLVTFTRDSESMRGRYQIESQ